jgi:hypothetical protein
MRARAGFYLNTRIACLLTSLSCYLLRNSDATPALLHQLRTYAHAGYDAGYYLGCFADGSDHPQLDQLLDITADMTPRRCAALARASGVGACGCTQARTMRSACAALLHSLLAHGLIVVLRALCI